MGQRHKHADVITAWAEGKDVQLWDDVAKRWWDVPTPSFYEKRKYRIKPPAKKCRVALFRDTFRSEIYTGTADTQEGAEFCEKDRDFIRWLTDWIEYDE